MRSIPDPSDAWTPDDARRVFAEWQRVGGTLAAFARQQRISPARLYWWKKRLASELPDVTMLSLVPATVVSSETESGAITIRLPSGISIKASNSSPRWIAAVVAELTRST